MKLGPTSLGLWRGIDTERLTIFFVCSEDNSGYAAAPGTGAGPVENPDVKDVLPYARLLDFDPELRLAVPEPEAWSMMHDKEYLSTLSEKEIKRQDIIHELIQTEKNHCAVLLIIDQVTVISKSEFGF